jgi:ATP-binding cassette subfamily F protein 3
MLTVSNLDKAFGPEEIFRDVSFQLGERERAALVGVNGAGKSTLLRITAGADTSSRGEISFAHGSRVTYLAQESRFESDRTLREEARLAFAEALAAAARMRDLEREMESASGAALDELFQEYERLSLHFEVAGGYDVEHRTEEVLTGLGFTAEQFDEPVRVLSGGQKTRVGLAKALLADPDLLLLDEPTNHLDLGMIEWLEGFLREWSGAAIIVSHDRYFLDRVTERTLELSFGRLEDYPAPYARYLDLRAERLARRRQEYQEQQEFIARTEEFIRRYKAGQRSREARGRQTRLDRLERVERPQEHAALNLNMHPTFRSGRNVVHGTPLRVGYRADSVARELFSTEELRIERGDRVAIVGPNGSGKSTLLRTLVGEIPPLKGRVELGTNVKLGYYAQGHEGLPPEGTPLSILLSTQPMGEEGARNYLARFLFRGDEVLRPVGALSGGERSRLALACLLVEGSNVLVLDEPTNHLDIQSRETLEAMLANYEGTVLFVSHDRFFIDRVANRVWELEGGTFRQYLGNYSDAARARDRPAPQVAGAQVPAAKAKVAPTAPRPVAPRFSAGSESRIQRRLAAVERDIARLEGTLNELSDAVAIAGVNGDAATLEALAAEYTSSQEELESVYELWHELQEQLAQLAVPVA